MVQYETVIIWGAGKVGERVIKQLETEVSSYKLLGFGDNKKRGMYCGYPIIPIEEIDNSTIVIMAVASAENMMEIYYMLYDLGFRKVYWYFGKENTLYSSMNIEDFLKESCIFCSNWGESVIKQVEMHVVDFCNLNCRGCTHYSPVFPKEYPDVEIRMKDVEKLKKKFTHIINFYLLGGEPFLHPDIISYIRKTRKILPDTNIYIVTNGLLIPTLNEEVLQTIYDNEVIVSISEYEPTHRIINKIISTLDKYGIVYQIRPFDIKQKFNLPLTLDKNNHYARKCISNGCVNIWQGKIARCPSLMYIDVLNEKFGLTLPNEGIISLDDSLQGRELLKELKKEVPLCQHCVEYEIEWKRCGNNIDVSDFVV